MLPCNFNHLYYFYRVAVHKSVSKASKELLIAQSALSTQLKQLEESLEMTLFNRTKGGMTLTERGEILFRHASQMFETYEEMKRAMVLAEKQVRGPLNLASVYSVGNYLLPKILTDYHQKYPDVQINLELYSSNRVMEMLQENQVDLAIIAWNRQYPLLNSTVILQNSLILVAHVDHPLARKRKPRLEEIPEHRFIGYEAGTPTRIMIDSHFKSLGFPLTYVMESSNIATIKQLAVAGMGLALLPRFAVDLEIKLKMLRSIPITEAEIERPITLYWKERRVLTRPAQKFLEYIQDRDKGNAKGSAQELKSTESG
jgi:DNA-binding transcriptional LysR family regulator